MKASKKNSSDSFPKVVLNIVKRIPKGKVLTYGQIATLAGIPRAARIVGGILFRMGPDEKIPWQRVINAQGKISTYRVGMGEKQRELLEKEGLEFNSQDKVDLKKFQWWPTPVLIKKLGIDDEIAWKIQERMRF